MELHAPTHRLLLVPMIKKHGVENAGEKMQTSKRMENLVQLLRIKEETLPPDTVNVLSWRQRIKKADLGRRKFSPSSICHGKAWRKKYSNNRRKLHTSFTLLDRR